jgi:hypothetical protein
MLAAASATSIPFSLSEEPIQKRRLAFSFGALLTALAALVFGNVAEHLLDVAAAACVRGFVTA